MAHNRKDLSEQVIEEYLIAAKACLDKRRKRGLLGYPATLILLCTIDAIGHGLLLPIKNRHTRLDVLQQPPFNLNLTNAQVDNLTNRYRHLLTQVASVKLVENRDWSRGAKGTTALVEASAVGDAARKRDRRHGGLCFGRSAAIKPCA